MQFTWEAVTGAKAILGVRAGVRGITHATSS